MMKQTFQSILSTPERQKRLLRVAAGKRRYDYRPWGEEWNTRQEDRLLFFMAWQQTVGPGGPNDTTSTAVDMMGVHDEWKKVLSDEPRKVALFKKMEYL